MILEFLEDITYNPKYEILTKWAKDHKVEYKTLYYGFIKYKDAIFHNIISKKSIIKLEEFEEEHAKNKQESAAFLKNTTI